MEYLNKYFPNEISYIIYNDFLEVKTFEELMYLYYGDNFKLDGFLSKKYKIFENNIEYFHLPDYFKQGDIYLITNFKAKHTEYSLSNFAPYNNIKLYDIQNYIIFFFYYSHGYNPTYTGNYVRDKCEDNIILFHNKTFKIIKKNKFNPIYFLDNINNIGKPLDSIEFLSDFFKYFYGNKWVKNFIEYIDNDESHEIVSSSSDEDYF